MTPMPIFEGVGDELVYAAALFAAPIVLIFWSSFGSLALRFFKDGLLTAGSFLNGVWNNMWGGRGTSRSAGVPNGGRGFLANMVAPPQNDCCSICHDSFTFPCQTNCAHWFCGDCILRVWQHAAPQPCRCPICRGPINLLIPSNFEHSADPEAQRVLHGVANYNRYHGGGPLSIMQRARDTPLLLQRLAQDLMDPGRALPLMHRMRIIIYLVLLAFYVLSPRDILPEGIFGFIGLLDDFLVMVLVLFHLAAVYRTALVYQFGSRGN